MVEIAPILLIAFNRPLHTREVLATLRDARVPRLYASIDGPRTGWEDSGPRQSVIDLVRGVDWPCEVTIREREVNEGPGWGPRNAINWFVDLAGEGIVLEDDTVPSVGALRFLTQMLNRYREEPKVMSVAATSLGARRYRGAPDFFASRYATTWGWATWPRAWQRYDWTMADWPNLRGSEWLRNLGGSQGFAEYWRNTFDLTYADRDHFWDYQWQYSVWRAGGVALHPRVNLVTNIGFGSQSTHTTVTHRHLDRLAVGEIPESPMPPTNLRPVDSVDDWIGRYAYGTRRSLRGRIFRAVTGAG